MDAFVEVSFLELFSCVYYTVKTPFCEQWRGNVCGKGAIIAETVTSINDYAFSGCFSLKTIEIPESVTFIAETAFAKTGVTL